MLVDTHLHLDDGAFAPDRGAVLTRAMVAGVSRLITVGQDVETSRAAIALAEAHPGVYAAVGIHPHGAEGWTDDAMADLETMAHHPKVVAIGETGLDFYRTYAAPERQAAAFRAHVALARRLDMPLVVHDRDAHDAVLRILAEEGVSRVVLHAFSGSPQMLGAVLDRGYAIGLGGPITYRSARHAEEVGRTVPLDALVLETDSPYLAPAPMRGRRNEPAYLVHVAARVAAIRRLSVEALAEATTETATRIFHLP